MEDQEYAGLTWWRGMACHDDRPFPSTMWDQHILGGERPVAMTIIVIINLV